MKVIKKQTNSRMCIICGMNNEFGLKAPFYEMEDHTVMSVFEFHDHHQSYPGRAHGGMIATMLDEIVGRAVWIDEPLMWGVTMDIKVKYRKPVPLNETVIAKGVIVKNSSKFFVGNGFIYDKYGNVLAEANVNYFKLPIEKISDTATHDDINVFIPDNVTEINFIDKE